jgi:3-hydroxy acid dehydrogenase/malonic semialdehyde reductase
MRSMESQTILITGASAGIGAATAKAFAREGARLVLVARRVERLRALAEELAVAHGTESRCLDIDLKCHHDVAGRLATLSPEWQAVDVLVNNAGLARGTDKLQEGSLADWDEVIDVNIKGLLALCRCVVPWMLTRNRGHVINLGSIAGWEAYPGGAVYCATKHAVRALSRGLKMDLQGTPIRVTSIDPGLVETEFSLVRFRGDREKATQPYEGMVPLRGEDIAEAIVWSASRPAHVNISTMVIFPTAQASSMLVSRDSAD